MSKYVLILGSNLGDLENNLNRAVHEIESNIGTILSMSPVLYTEPIGNGVKNKFLNQSILIETNLDPEQLLDAVEIIERKFGRNKEKSVGWEAENRVFEDRVIDIDIALYDKKSQFEFADTWHSKRLLIPHHSIGTRPFVMQLLQSLGIKIITNFAEVK